MLITYFNKAKNIYYWLLDKIDKKSYIIKYPKYLRNLGVKISENPGDCWISPTIFLDSFSYESIEIGNDCTISFDVAVLVHDYSINNAFRLLGIPEEKQHRLIVRPVKIGNNCFIGARTTILPGSVIEDDCIIGAGTVVRGHIKNGSVASGNPVKIIGSVEEFALKHKHNNDYIFDVR